MNDSKYMMEVSDLRGSSVSKINLMKGNNSYNLNLSYGYYLYNIIE